MRGKKVMAISAGEKSDSKTAENRAATRLTLWIGPTPNRPAAPLIACRHPSARGASLVRPKQCGIFRASILFLKATVQEACSSLPARRSSRPSKATHRWSSPGMSAIGAVAPGINTCTSYSSILRHLNAGCLCQQDASSNENISVQQPMWCQRAGQWICHGNVVSARLSSLDSMR